MCVCLLILAPRFSRSRDRDDDGKYGGGGGGGDYYRDRGRDRYDDRYGGGGGGYYGRGKGGGKGGGYRDDRYHERRGGRGYRGGKGYGKGGYGKGGYGKGGGGKGGGGGFRTHGQAAEPVTLEPAADPEDVQIVQLLVMMGDFAGIAEEEEEVLDRVGAVTEALVDSDDKPRVRKLLVRCAGELPAQGPVIGTMVALISGKDAEFAQEIVSDAAQACFTRLNEGDVRGCKHLLGFLGSLVACGSLAVSGERGFGEVCVCVCVPCPAVRCRC